MQTISGTFAGRVQVQGAAAVGDEENHQMLLAQVTGPQTSPDPNWNGAVITYTAVLDLAGYGEGGEDDGQVGFDRVPLPGEQWAGTKVCL